MSFEVIDGLRVMEFANPGQLRDRLVNLVLEGKKQATAGLLTEYESEGEPIEFIGEKLVVIDSENQGVALIEVTNVEVCSFIDVPGEFALAEGEGDLSGDDFRKSHLAYWSGEGIEILDDTKVVQVYFKLIKKY